MRNRTTVALLAALYLTFGCQAAPTGPLDESSHPFDPSLAVLSEQTAFPFWERGPLITSDGEQYVFYFYVTDPLAIPDDFNLLELFDFRALGAEFAVESIEIRLDAEDFVPKKLHFFATAPVEFWFVPAGTLQAAAGDGFLGIDELLATGEVIIGHSSHFNEELHPGGGTAKQVLLQVQARGPLDEGGDFLFNLSGHFNQQTGEIDGVARVRLQGS